MYGIDRYFSTVTRQIRIVGAPHVKRVRGCIDVAYEWPDTPESGRRSAGISNVTAANTLVNDFLRLGRTQFGTVEVRQACGRGKGLTRTKETITKKSLVERAVSA